MKGRATPARVVGCTLLCALLLGPTDVSAQPFRYEVGVDGAVSYTFGEAIEGVRSGSVQTWAFPAQRVRLGYLLSERLQLEASTGFSVADFGEVSTVRYAFGLKSLMSLKGGPYSGPFPVDPFGWEGAGPNPWAGQPEGAASRPLWRAGAAPSGTP